MRFASPRAAIRGIRRVRQGQNGHYKSAAAAAASAIMNQGKSALNTRMPTHVLREAQTLIAIHALHASIHKPAPFSAFFHKFHIPPAFSLILIRGASAHCCIFPSIYCYTLWVRRFRSLPAAVVRSCTPPLGHPIAEQVCATASRARALGLATTASECTLSVFVPRLVQQHPRWLGLIG